MTTRTRGTSTGHSKNTGVKTWPGKGPWGQTPFQVNDDPEISQLDEEYDPELDQSDPIVCQVCRKLTDFWVIVDPEWSLAPMDPFPGHADPGVFKVHVNTGVKFHKLLSLTCARLTPEDLLGVTIHDCSWTM